MKAQRWTKRVVVAAVMFGLLGVPARPTNQSAFSQEQTNPTNPIDQEDQDLAGLPAEPSPDAPPAKTVEPAKIQLPPDLAEVVRLAQSGMGDDVILAYIQKSTPTTPISADQILYLRDLGISQKVLEALVQRQPATPQLTAQTPVAAPAVPTPPADVQASSGVAPDYQYYYSYLAPYGSWLNLPSYGWCWQPTAVVINPYWRPYCDGGYWAWSDWGWYWNSYYAWGWAPFHYGRWCHYPNYGWCWRPDRHWGPAWVCWRNSGHHSGWAPLPPGSHHHAGSGWTHNGHHVDSHHDFGLSASAFTFVSQDHFRDRHLRQQRLPDAEARTVFNRSTVNNQMSVGANNRLINRGVDPQRIAAATRTPVREVPVAQLQTQQRATWTRPTAATRTWSAAAASPVRQTSAPQVSGSRYQRPEMTRGQPMATQSAPAARIGGAAPSRNVAPSTSLSAPARSIAPAQRPARETYRPAPTQRVYTQPPRPMYSAPAPRSIGVPTMPRSYGSRNAPPVSIGSSSWRGVGSSPGYQRSAPAFSGRSYSAPPSFSSRSVPQARMAPSAPSFSGRSAPASGRSGGGWGHGGRGR